MSTLEPLLGHGIATLTDRDRWWEARTFIMPLFSASMLNAYLDEAITSINHEVAALAEVADRGETIDLYEWMHEATFRVLVRTVFRKGIDVEEIPELTRLFNTMTGYISIRYITLNLPIDWAIPAARRGKRALEQLDKRVYRLIAERRAAGVVEAEDMLDALLLARAEDGRALSDKEIRDNCMTMLFGGHETTAGSLTWAWGLLAANPRARDAMLSEIDTALKGRLPASFADLKALPYTEAVFEEAMRLYPMFALLFREAAEDDVLGGFRIDKGDLIAFSAYTIHHDDSVWTNASRFEPERHLGAAKSQRHKSAYLPFSQGQRGCIGERMARMEGVLMLAILSQNFVFDLVGDLPDVKVSMSLKPIGGMQVKVTRRG
jgi:cytochrome P450